MRNATITTNKDATQTLTGSTRMDVLLTLLIAALMVLGEAMPTYMGAEGASTTSTAAQCK